MKKRILALHLAALMLLPLCGCGGGDEADASATDVTATDVPENADGADTADATGTDVTDPTLTVSEAVNTLKGIPPPLLGLDANNMSKYNVYPAEETVKVEGMTCAKLFVYETDEAAGTNNIVGIFLLARDGSKLYKLDAGTGVATLMDLPDGALPNASPSPEASPAAEDKGDAEKSEK